MTQQANKGDAVSAVVVVLFVDMRLSVLVLIFACFMFSTITRAFRSAPLYSVQRSFARAMSAGAPDTSIVAVCQQKIQDALQAESVKVIGELLKRVSPCTWPIVPSLCVL